MIKEGKKTENPKMKKKEKKIEKETKNSESQLLENRRMEKKTHFEIEKN